MDTKEKVLCFGAFRIKQELCAFQGLLFSMGQGAKFLADRSKLLFIDREQAEADPTYKQVIPYVIVVCGNRVFRYRRGKAGGENRLHGKYSIGIGGHINPVDGTADSLDYQAAARREIEEEIGIKGIALSKPVAFINEDSTEVGRVHFGIVHVLQVKDTKEVIAKCPSLLDVQFVLPEELYAALGYAESRSAYEVWSIFCMTHLETIMLTARNES